MNLSKNFITPLVIFITALLFCTTVSADENKKVLTAQLVRTLGYGGAIHQYKNYVLRGDEKYHHNSSKKFAEARQIIASLKVMPDLTAIDSKALTDIDATIAQYDQSLVVIENVYATETSLSKILSQTDKQVKISDKAAIEGLATLRNSHTWSTLEELEYQLGYGNAIHNFKNYVIRGKEKYRERADLWFVEAEKSINLLRKELEGKESYANMLLVVSDTVTAYHNALAKIQKNYAKAEGITSEMVLNVVVKGSDKVVKINDSTTVEALAALANVK